MNETFNKHIRLEAAPWYVLQQDNNAEYDTEAAKKILEQLPWKTD